MKARKSESLVNVSSAGRSSSGSMGGSGESAAAGADGAGSRRNALPRSARFNRDQRVRKPGGSAKLVLLDRRLAGGVALAPALFKGRVDVVAGDVALHPMHYEIGDRYALDHHV